MGKRNKKQRQEKALARLQEDFKTMKEPINSKGYIPYRYKLIQESIKKLESKLSK